MHGRLFTHLLTHTFLLQNDIDALVDDQNNQFDTLAADFNSTHDDAQVLQYDLSGLFGSVLANPSNAAFQGAFTNTNEACRAGDLDDAQAAGFTVQDCPNPQDYLFWDEV